ncbi:SMP-30/gluconolactonase/LRE family protein [Ramlibacter sp.]|uniref:SMP-30/gluconolactonase/LRE family protein n=1 Tax=Ramlibacter sp. TaxID=1917967 RepID=UPI00182559D3|nr:SMP-30/gluconolactonase/LRE family protein [Ramlibacter sp.]MBA2675906.1 SMP-30/gluconolactonase/LRE family protein [Ramlibacter sp.]
MSATTSTPAVEVVCALRDKVGESPLWSASEQALYWVDIEGRAVRCHDWATRGTRSWDLPERVACIALRDGGGLVAGMDTGIFALDLPPQGPGSARLLQPVRHAREGMRFNDGRLDRQGRFWATTMVRDMALAAADGVLLRYDAQGLSAPLVDGLVTGNGLAFSPDGRTLYLSDSHPDVQRIWRFDLGDDGVPRNRTDFADMRPLPGRPDGAAVDADGCYWICGNDGGMVHRFTPDGRLDRSLALPVSKPSMCSFGGPDLDWLFVTSIPPARPATGYDASLDGAVLALRPGVRGIAETVFRSQAPTQHKETA